MFHVRQMSPEDIEFAVQITDTMNWNLTEQDFNFMMSLEPEGCFVLMHDSEKIGITTTVSFGRVGWIGNVIVNENLRRRGAGSTLIKHAIKYLKSKGTETIGLYSYKEKVNFYTQLGFERDLEFTVLKGKAFPSSRIEASIRKIEESDIPKIVTFDSFYFGAWREKLLEKIAGAKENLGYCHIENGEIFGYAMAKVFDHYAEIGPLICRRENSTTAVALLKKILKELEGFEVSMCLPKKEEELVSMLLDAGFTESFDVIRMFHGQSTFKDCIYIAESLERG
ncbi:MAG: GNAT family N-acetyltransferase [Candidatus Bathyarchaeia archaeon]